MLALGAQAAWVGTRFLLAEEAPVHERYRQRLIDAARDRRRCGSPTSSTAAGRTRRIARSATRRSTRGRPPGARLPARGPGEGEQVATWLERRARSRATRAATPVDGMEGDIDAMSLWAGQGVALAHAGASRRPRSSPSSSRGCSLSDMERAVKVACVQAEPVILDREATLDRLEQLAAEAAGNGAELVVFPETFVPVYPSSRWAKAFAGWQNDGAKQVFAQIAQNSVAVGSPAERRLGAAAQELGVWLVTGVNEVEPEQPGTIYNSLLYHSPDGELALHHRKLVPTNHERLIWGQGDGRGLHAVETGFGRIGGLICWENYMPLARFALYESGVEIYIASTADDGDAWQATLVHIARESRAYVVAPCHFQRASSYPDDFPLASELEGAGLLGRGGSAILAPDGSYLAGPLYDEEGILYAELDPSTLLAERQRFDPVGHYNRPDVLQLTVRGDDATPSRRPSARSARS